MKVATTILLLLVAGTTRTAVSAQEDNCECARKASAAAASILSDASITRTQLTAADGQRQDFQNHHQACTAELEAATVGAVAAANSPASTRELQALEAAIAELKQTISSADAVQSALIETESATSKWEATEEVARTKHLPAIDRYREKREEVNFHVLDKQTKVTKLAENIVQLIAEPMPVVNYDKMQSDFQSFYRNLVGTPDEQVVAE
mmetsp:Transcript_11350/g.18778  ORF Transcript_11350/g.18778 Transcript_11350/m.18778 type:complete len:208 (-) Transcript_11350:160-783(-)|eukprot:CAMPEP_0119010078 /NCGR_PEP_ID=MMETSP1176-20130426/4773_1 /TAXON_ID=265551 /ORGANISM="Synedropsis recta cf, Strain CCMP1620" /LENGTH=207 /DNA_ID=CAMNT_0006962687 /DNA_START=87 /DNA_END=710 /DNA_ORIENTATION=-